MLEIGGRGEFQLYDTVEVARLNLMGVTPAYHTEKSKRDTVSQSIHRCLQLQVLKTQHIDILTAAWLFYHIDYSSTCPRYNEYYFVKNDGFVKKLLSSHCCETTGDTQLPCEAALLV